MSSQERYWSPPQPETPTTPLTPPPPTPTPTPTDAPILTLFAATMPVSTAPTIASPANQPTINLAPPRPGELLRFGPGVPAPVVTEHLTQAAAVWRGEVPAGDDTHSPRHRRRLLAWLLPLLVLLAVLAILLWQHSGPQLTVTNASASVSSPTLTCDGTANITATLHTNGASGTITYRWRRSDGTLSDTLRQQVARGSTDVHVVLLWSFHGHGTMNATATLELLSPTPTAASTTFTYTCP